jgi:hypothetical protein
MVGALGTNLLSPSVRTYGANYIFLILKGYHPLPWRDSISRPIAPVYLVADGDDITILRRQGRVPIVSE